MELAFDLLLTLLVELPVIGFFFKKRKRQPAIIIGLVVNLVTWPLSQIVRLKFPDLDILWIKAGVTVVETVAFYYFMGRNWKRAILISFAANGASILATHFIKFPAELFVKKSNMIR